MRVSTAFAALVFAGSLYVFAQFGLGAIGLLGVEFLYITNTGR